MSLNNMSEQQLLEKLAAIIYEEAGQDWDECRRAATYILAVIKTEKQSAQAEVTREIATEMQEIRNSGFSDGDIKVKLVEKYDFHLRLAHQEPLSAQDRYDFYRGTEYVIDYLIGELESRH